MSRLKDIFPGLSMAESHLSQTLGGSGSALDNPRSGQRVKVPLRLILAAFYSDATIRVYIKIAALAMRPEGCTASVATIAAYLNVSTATVERALRELRAIAPDGIVELSESTRRTKRGGTGTTALRRVRRLDPKEPFVWVPVCASEELSPRNLRAFAFISYSVIQRIPLTVSDLAESLRHRSGANAGNAISRKSAREIIKSLVEKGWVAVSRRAGFQGRNVFEVNSRPIPQPLEQPSESGSSSSHPGDGSGGHPGDGSLAYKEDPKTDRHEKKDVFPSAGGEPQVVGASERAPGTASREKPVDGNREGALRADDSFPAPLPPAAPAAKKPAQKPARKPAPQPSPRPTAFSRATYAALEPVRFLLDGVRGYVLNRAAREIENQLADGMTVERFRDRITTRLAGTMVSEIEDPGRWLLGVALPRWGCADPACESGTVWHTGQECSACREIRFLYANRLLDHHRGGAPTPVPPRPCCPSCGRPHRPGNEGECADCAEEREAAVRRFIEQPPARTPAEPTESAEPTEPAVPEHRCGGRDGHCTRMASADGLCWRCMTGTPERSIPRPRRRSGVPAMTSSEPR
ncbi:helix-turn-helix domain-containing protein [Streptomyces sp. NPDC059431]|uniref:helix-turn-helix domain-containing protein n=1 Tax=Streptomyces sp. NPDC059431 TaxID=3346828 RepID=UPI0036CE96B2